MNSARRERERERARVRKVRFKFRPEFVQTKLSLAFAYDELTTLRTDETWEEDGRIS